MRRVFAVAVAALLVSVLVSVSGSGPALALTDNPAWLEEATMQLAADKECEVAYYIRVTEDDIGGRKTYAARAQCVDGRQFDVTKFETDDVFTIRTCQSEVC